jgi:hypothetical protein
MNTASPAIANGKPNTPTMMKKKSTPMSAAVIPQTRRNTLLVFISPLDFQTSGSIAMRYRACAEPEVTLTLPSTAFSARTSGVRFTVVPCFVAMQLSNSSAITFD